MLFVTAGDPDLAALPEILTSLQAAGADVIEVGIPFSDPIADGPSIQASSQRALDRGVTPAEVLRVLSTVRLSIPVVLMGYMNSALRMGLEEFARQGSESGASGMIVCDLIPEEGEEWGEIARKAGIDTIYLAAPTSTSERIDRVCAASSGFVYAVSRTGVTGVGHSSASDPEALVALIRSRTELPVFVGFGISSAEAVAKVCEYADGAIIGSWLVDRLVTDWHDDSKRANLLDEIRRMKEATRIYG